VTAAFTGFGFMVSTGYYQLYFLLVIMQFYLAFPLVLGLLRRARGHHGLVIAITVLAQIAIAIGMHWKLFPREMVKFGQQDVISYPLYLIGGCVVAFHLDQVHA
jgi:peptidoglycan/LPS O-acetylase OafA/YrhL